MACQSQPLYRLISILNLKNLLACFAKKEGLKFRVLLKMSFVNNLKMKLILRGIKSERMRRKCLSLRS